SSPTSPIVRSRHQGPSHALHHRAPPSLPTRRSSDLMDEHRELLVVALLAGPQAPALEGEGAHLLDDHAAAAVDDPQRQRAVAGEDRKSTRLNSSHVSISYAVFCLKKKNIQLNQEIAM